MADPRRFWQPQKWLTALKRSWESFWTDTQPSVAPVSYDRAPLPLETREDLLAAVELLTSPRCWEFSQFRKILVALAKAGDGAYVPAHHRPDSIYLRGFEDTFARVAAKSQYTEHARALFADIQRNSLLFGRETAGTTHNVQIDLGFQPGREQYQRLIGVLHVHPDRDPNIFLHGMGFSDIDYTMFLANPQLIINIIIYRANIFLALKTTSTFNAIAEDSLKRRISAIMAEVRQTYFGKPVIYMLSNFNKQVCIEYGLTLYYADEKSRFLATRVEVTK